MNLHKDFEKLLSKYNLTCSGLLLANDAIIDSLVDNISKECYEMELEHEGEEYRRETKVFEFCDDSFMFEFEVDGSVRWIREMSTYEYPGDCYVEMLSKEVYIEFIETCEFQQRLLLTEEQLNIIKKALLGVIYA